MEVNNTLQLLFILSCHRDFSSALVTEVLLGKLLQYLVVSITEIDEENVTYCFRFLANCICKDMYEIVLRFMVENDMVVAILRSAEVNESVLWFLGNACKLCSNHVFFEMMFR